jgi:hypothetical protein
LILVPIVYTSTYAWYFVKGHSIIEFFKVQKYIMNFYSTGAKVPVPGTILPLLLFGVWLTHFGAIQRIPEWHVGWPLLFLITYYGIHKRYSFIPPSIQLLFLWIVVYGIFLCFTPIYPRYLLLVLPFLYNLCIWAILEVSKVGKVSELSEGKSPQSPFSRGNN